MMLRPRDTPDQRNLSACLDISPAPVRLSWNQDVFGNCITTAGFADRALELSFTSTLRVHHEHQDEAAIERSIARHARTFPFSYDPDDIADLSRLVARQYPDSQHQLDRWARTFLAAGGATRTMALLTGMTRQIKRQFTYQIREEPGVQMPTETLGRGTGTCRDFAVLMMEAVRCLGLAARFVSGYVHSPKAAPSEYLGGGSTHAWLQVYLPGAGWVEFDPTNDIVGSRDLIRVMAVRDAAQAIPLTGTWYGQPSDYLGMDVSVHVTSEDAETPTPFPQSPERLP